MTTEIKECGCDISAFAPEDCGCYVKHTWINANGEYFAEVSAFYGEKTGLITNIRVAHEHREKGIGTEIIEKMVDVMKNVGTQSTGYIEKVYASPSEKSKGIFERNSFVQETEAAWVKKL